MPDATTKVCILCKQDCANKPRVKDELGRYVCRPCLDERKKAAAKPVAAPMKAKTPTAQPAPAFDDDQPLDLSEPEVAVIAQAKVCPSCSRQMPAGAAICVHCGFDEHKGFQRATGVGADSRKGGILKCPKCGYDLRGLKKPKCPECGTVVRAKSRREESLETSRSIVRWEYYKPLILIGIGFGGLILMRVAQGETDRLLFDLVGCVAVSVLGMVSYFIFGAVWIGFNAPLHLIALRLLGVFAVTILIESVPTVPGMGIWKLIVGLAVYFGLLMKLLELDFKEAMIMTAIMRAVATGTMIALFMILKP